MGCQMNVGLERPCWLWAGEQPHPSSGDNFKVSFGAPLAGGHSLSREEWARGWSEEGRHCRDALSGQAGTQWPVLCRAPLVSGSPGVLAGVCCTRSLLTRSIGRPVLLGLAFWDKETTRWCNEHVTRRKCRKGGSRELSREGERRGHVTVLIWSDTVG